MRIITDILNMIDEEMTCLRDETNDQICLLTNLEEMFDEIEDHQINLEMLQTNQSAGSFFDEISKWKTTLQHIEGVLQQ